MDFRFATICDSQFLAELNHQLIRDEGHRNRMTIPELRERMEQWLAAEYRAVIFKNETGVVGYALYRTGADEIYLRQLFIVPGHRRQGYGRAAVGMLREQIWPANKRLTVDVLLANTGAVRFWRSAGYRDYALTLEIMPSETMRATPG